MRFWDSSAVVPLLIQQPSSRAVDAWMLVDRDIAMWKLTPVEIASALWRLVRDGDLPEEEASAVEARVQDFAGASHIVADIDGVQSVARRLLRVHNLRAGDALQLGASLVWSGGRPQGRTLHTLDARLALAARREGFHVPEV
jgi:hypothetical protein